MSVADPMNLMGMIHAVNPYKDFYYKDWEYDLQGWGGHRDYFLKKIAETEPKVIVEVGTWKGRSAIMMAGICEELGLDDTQIICVDTWLGATEFYEKQGDEKRYKSLKHMHGYPQVYYQFLANVMHHGYQDRIIPFPQTSVNAARFFNRRGLEFDMVYIDGSHDYEDVQQDIKFWTRIVDPKDPKKLVCGDDYCMYWRGVMDAVDEHAFDKNLTVDHQRFQNPAPDAPSDYWSFKV